ncbi:YceD family protein [Branchiibius cervicis]|uniref:YceD family protein n=1 Tax=Branchiibius cervicis TaxID=908252 RepID=A0ABW2AU19_9MICO
MPFEPQRPLVLDTRELARRPGQMVTEQVSVPAPDALGNAVIEVPAGEPMRLDLRLESVLEGVLVSSSVQAEAVGSCVRCLDDVTYDVDVTFQELFAYPDRAAHHHEVAPVDDEEEIYELDGDLADLEPMLRDAIVPALPLQPMCREDCLGLCSECGAHLNDDPDHHHEVLDPRWAALSQLASTPDDEKRN